MNSFQFNRVCSYHHSTRKLKQEYGKTPEYLEKRKEEISRNEEYLREYMKERSREGEMSVMSEEDKDKIIRGLKENWDFAYKVTYKSICLQTLC